MSNAPTRRQIISLYRCLLRESEKFPNYNFRSYALRRVKDAFRENQALTDKKIIKKEYDAGKENLNVISRQIVVGSLYKTDKLVIENISNE